MVKIDKDTFVRFACISAGMLFTLVTLIVSIIRNDLPNIAVSLVTFILVWVPQIVEKIFSCKINSVFYVICIIYTLCPMLGYCYDMYYVTSWWDKLLHTFAGIVFAVFGFYLFDMRGKKKDDVLPGIVFAFCFSVTVAACWEFIEFGCDSLLGTDMQRDTIINFINSHNLNEGVGVIGRIENITDVTVNGAVLPTEGYLDIGLIDSMNDMILETVGAIVLCTFYMADKCKHPLFRYNGNESDEKKESASEK